MDKFRGILDKRNDLFKKCINIDEFRKFVKSQRFKDEVMALLQPRYERGELNAEDPSIYTDIDVNADPATQDIYINAVRMVGRNYERKAHVSLHLSPGKRDEIEGAIHGKSNQREGEFLRYYLDFSQGRPRLVHVGYEEWTFQGYNPSAYNTLTTNAPRYFIQAVFTVLNKYLQEFIDERLCKDITAPSATASASASAPATGYGLGSGSGSRFVFSPSRTASAQSYESKESKESKNENNRGIESSLSGTGAVTSITEKKKKAVEGLLESFGKVYEEFTTLIDRGVLFEEYEGIENAKQFFEKIYEDLQSIEELSSGSGASAAASASKITGRKNIVDLLTETLRKNIEIIAQTRRGIETGNQMTTIARVRPLAKRLTAEEIDEIIRRFRIELEYYEERNIILQRALDRIRLFQERLDAYKQSFMKIPDELSEEFFSTFEPIKSNVFSALIDKVIETQNDMDIDKLYLDSYALSAQAAIEVNRIKKEQLKTASKKEAKKLNEEIAKNDIEIMENLERIKHFKRKQEEDNFTIATIWPLLRGLELAGSLRVPDWIPKPRMNGGNYRKVTRRNKKQRKTRKQK